MAEPANLEVSTTSANPSYFVRLGKLSAKVQERALEKSLLRARKARDSTYAAVAQITSTLDLVESARASLGTAGNQIAGASEQLLQRWTEWKQKQGGEGLTEESEPDVSKDESEVRIYLLWGLTKCLEKMFGFVIWHHAFKTELRKRSSWDTDALYLMPGFWLESFIAWFQ